MAKDDTRYPELRIEPELMDKLRDIVKRRGEVQALVDKAEGNKTKVKPAIFSKVITDYKSRLQAINDEFVPLSEQVKRGLEEVQMRENDIRARLQEVSDDLDEQRFRCQIGEFPEQDLEPIEAEMGEVQRELNEQIRTLETTYEECSRCLSEPPPEPAPIISGESQVADISADVTEITRAPSPPPPPPDATAPIELHRLTPRGDAPQPPEAEGPPVPEPPAERELAPVAEVEAEPDAKATPEPPPTPAPEPEPVPSPGHALKLIKKSGDSELYPLRSDKLSIGRSPKSDIVLKVAGVSRTHAHVVRTGDDQFTIIDTSGGGGVAINGKKQKKAALRTGDKISIASIELEVVSA